MRRIFLILFVFLIVQNSLFAYFSPAEGKKLHYRIIGFTFPAQQGTGNYRIEIARGSYYSADSFRRNIIISENSKTNKIILEVPSFAEQYTWRAVFKAGRSSATESELHHFSTFNPDTFGSPSILKIKQPAEKYEDAYIFLDQARALFDMKGNAVWYLPTAGETGTPKVPIRDLKISPQGTITYVMEGEQVFEINYDCDILWKGPNDGTVSGNRKEHYHHEFTRLSNGHYMAMGSAPASKQPNIVRPENSMPKNNMPGKNAPRPPSDTSRNGERKKNIFSPFGTIIEYDEKGNVVWSWKSSSYFLGSDIFHYADKDGQRINDVHLNSFYFDEKAQIIYASFKNISRIVKIKYPEGTILNAYGEVYISGVEEKGNGLFCYQHACRSTKDGLLYLFNNNSCNPTCYPEVLVMEQPATENGTLKKVWEYECPVQSLNFRLLGQKLGKGDGTTGGNVIELPDQSFFISLCSPYSLVLIVNRDKEILWCAEPARWNPTEKNYTAFPQYRASIITSREELERLVWNAQGK